MAENALPFLILGIVAGALNALAGGGPIIVVAALAASGLPAEIASLTSTAALLPGQLASGWQGRASLGPFGPPSWRLSLVVIVLAGGAAGALLLLLTPTAIFARLLPGLILFAVALYALNSRPESNRHGDQPTSIRPVHLGWFIPLAIYGGFYGGGNSFMVLALLARTRADVRVAAHIKNLLVLLMNVAATAIFLASGDIAWAIAVPLGAGALFGALCGARLIDRLDPALLRFGVIALGCLLAMWLALRA